MIKKIEKHKTWSTKGSLCRDKTFNFFFLSYIYQEVLSPLSLPKYFFFNLVTSCFYLGGPSQENCFGGGRDYFLKQHFMILRGNVLNISRTVPFWRKSRWRKLISVTTETQTPQLHRTIILWFKNKCITQYFHYMCFVFYISYFL